MVSKEEDLWVVALESLLAHGVALSVCGHNGDHVASLQRLTRTGLTLYELAANPDQYETEDVLDNYAVGSTMLEAAFAAEQRWLAEEVGHGAAPGATYAERAANRIAALERDRAVYWTDVYARGRVKFFEAEEGWGAIESDAAPGDVFVHYSIIEGSGFRFLDAGDLVEFRFDTPGQDGCAHRATWARRL